MTVLFPVVVALAEPVRDFLVRSWRWTGRRIRVTPMSAQWLQAHEHSSAKRGMDR
jgi:hypothetical protein